MVRGAWMYAVSAPIGWKYRDDEPVGAQYITAASKAVSRPELLGGQKPLTKPPEYPHARCKRGTRIVTPRRRATSFSAPACLIQVRGQRYQSEFSFGLAPEWSLVRFRVVRCMRARSIAETDVTSLTSSLNEVSVNSCVLSRKPMRMLSHYGSRISEHASARTIPRSTARGSPHPLHCAIPDIKTRFPGFILYMIHVVALVRAEDTDRGGGC